MKNTNQKEVSFLILAAVFWLGLFFYNFGFNWFTFLWAVFAFVSVLTIIDIREQRVKREATRREVELARDLETIRQESGRRQARTNVVNWFKTHFAQAEAFSQQDLAAFIDSDMSADDLTTELLRKVRAMPGLVLGYQTISGNSFDIKQKQEHRDRHTYIIGKSGSGKTNLLRNLIQQDLDADEGLGVIAPEHEMLTEEILPFIPDARVKDVIYIDPADAHPIFFNPLQLDPGEDPDIKVDEVFSIFQRLTSESGPRMDAILRQALSALVGRPGATLMDIDKLLSRSDPGFRNEVIRTCQDERVVQFWQEDYPTFPKDAHFPITTRLGRLLGPRAVRSMLCNPVHSINFQQCMNDGRILLFNLSDGLLGEHNSQLLGQLVVSKFQLAVMARARQLKAERRNFYLYIDEFQTFTGTAAASYEKILSRARKYHLGLILAHQQTGQIPTSLLKEIMGNVSTSICFALSGEDTRKFSKEFLVPDEFGRSVPLPDEQILNLSVGQAWCKMGQRTLRINTYLAPQQGSSKRAEWVIRESRSNLASASRGNSTDCVNTEAQSRRETYRQPPVKKAASVPGTATKSPKHDDDDFD